MEKGVYAKYNNKVYRVSKYDCDYISMVSRDNSDLENGFVEKNYPSTLKDVENLPELYIKEEKRTEIHQLYKIDYKAKYNGHIYNVVFLDDSSKIEIGTTDAKLAKENGFNRSDKYYYKKLVDVKDVELIEIKELLRI